jgi:hypothetical protein
MFWCFKGKRKSMKCEMETQKTMLLKQEKMIWKSFVTIIKSQSRDEKGFKAIIMITLCVE